MLEQKTDMYRAAGSVRLGIRTRAVTGTIQRRHFWEGLGKMVGYFPV